MMQVEFYVLSLLPALVGMVRCDSPCVHSGAQPNTLSGMLYIHHVFRHKLSIIEQKGLLLFFSEMLIIVV
jgi:hypothetical protein